MLIVHVVLRHVALPLLLSWLGELVRGEDLGPAILEEADSLTSPDVFRLLHGVLVGGALQEGEH